MSGKAELQIELAGQAPFALGSLRVSPSTLEVIRGERRETLEPRIMQVFVALYRSRGLVVSRDELIRTCWEGRTVGDDAINRCIARLRRLAETEGGFAIETIPRVGYRLNATADEPAADDDLPATAPWWHRLSVSTPLAWAAVTFGAVVLAAVLIYAAVSAWPGGQSGSVATPAVNRVAVLPFEPLGSGQDLHVFGEAVAEQIIGVLNENQVEAVSRAQLSSLRSSDRDSAAIKLRADFILDGTVHRTAQGLSVVVHLDRASTHTTLWTASFYQQGQDAVGLQSQVAARAVDCIKAALRAAVTGDDTAISAYLKAQENARAGGRSATALRRDQMRIVVSRAPGFSGGYSGLAVSAAQLAQMSEDGEALRKEASGAIARALELNPKNGEAYFAKALLAPPADFSQQEAIYRQGLAVDPDDPTLNSSLAALMYDVGRAGDALALQQRAVMLDPLSPRKTAGLAAYESMLGNRARARTVIDRAAEQWPDNLDVWATRLIILSDFGQGAEARLMLSAARSRPNRLEPDLLAAIAAYLESLESPAQAARARAKRALMTAYESNHIGFEATIYLLGRIGELDAAYSLSGRYFTGSDRANGRLDTSPFFRPQSTPLRADKRFLPLVERLGLVQYWRTHTAPDFCASERNALCSALRRNTPPGQ